MSIACVLHLSVLTLHSRIFLDPSAFLHSWYISFPLPLNFIRELLNSQTCSHFFISYPVPQYDNKSTHFHCKRVNLIIDFYSGRGTSSMLSSSDRLLTPSSLITSRIFSNANQRSYVLRDNFFV